MRGEEGGREGGGEGGGQRRPSYTVPEEYAEYKLKEGMSVFCNGEMGLYSYTVSIVVQGGVRGGRWERGWREGRRTETSKLYCT